MSLFCNGGGAAGRLWEILEVLPKKAKSVDFVSVVVSMKTRTSVLKSIIAFAVLSGLSTPQLLAEGIASMTTVTRENATSLKHHRLDVIRKSQRGRSYIVVEVRPVEGCPFIGCSVKVYDGSGEKTLLQFDPAIGQAPKRKDLSKGARVYFHVADEMVDDVEIRYHLHANEYQSHVFTIPRLQVAKIANLR